MHGSYYSKCRIYLSQHAPWSPCGSLAIASNTSSRITPLRGMHGLCGMLTEANIPNYVWPLLFKLSEDTKDLRTASDLREPIVPKDSWEKRGQQASCWMFQNITWTGTITAIVHPLPKNPPIIAKLIYRDYGLYETRCPCELLLRAMGRQHATCETTATP